MPAKKDDKYQIEVNIPGATNETKVGDLTVHQLVDLLSDFTTKLLTYGRPLDPEIISEVMKQIRKQITEPDEAVQRLQREIIKEISSARVDAGRSPFAGGSIPASEVRRGKGSVSRGKGSVSRGKGSVSRGKGS
jgi:hypothetical protein